MFKQCAQFRNRAITFAVASALGVSGMALAVVPAGGASAVAGPTRTVTLPTAGAQFSVLTHATQLSRGDVASSAVALTKPVHVTVALSLRDAAGMQAFLAQPSHGVMSQAQMQNHLPTAAQAQAVADYLKRAGFTNIKISANRMLVNATGSASAVQTAFKTSLVNVRTHDGRSAFANSAAIQIPASLHGVVQAVLGLQTVHMAHVQVTPESTVGVAAHNPLDFASIYDASILPAATDIDVGILGWGSMSQAVTDLGTFTTQNSLATVNASVVCVDYGGYNSGVINTTDSSCDNFDQGTTEWDIDSQDIVAMSGGVRSLTFYSAYGGYNASITNLINEVVTPTAGEPTAQVLNMSFGECERGEDINQGGDGSAQVDDALFELAASQGRTFSASTGDYGSNECFDGQLDSASYPASSPWVVAVSGTTLRASDTTWARENVWLDSGGSPSSFERAQSWQAPFTYGTYAGSRGPDLAFDANPSSGAVVITYGEPSEWGGTSLASPIFVGAWARILEGNPTVGFAAPQLYTLPAAAMHDVRAGNNGQYGAKPGWDWATGLGSFDVGRVAAILTPAAPTTRPSRTSR